MELKIKDIISDFQNVIVVPTDFSEVCNNAIIHTLQIAKYIKYKVILLHVVSNEGESNQVRLKDLENRLKLQTEKYATNSGVEVSYIIKRGKLLKQIHKTVKESGANMMILGTHGKVGLQTILGSRAFKLISKSTVPTIIVQQQTATKFYKNIVLPVAIDIHDRQKINWAIYISKIFNSTIHILPREESNEQLKSKTISVVNQVKNIFDKHNVKYIDAVSSSVSNNFTKKVIDYSVDNDVDLIMTMMHTEEGIVPFFNTQDEQIIFNTAQIPVVCINGK